MTALTALAALFAFTSPGQGPDKITLAGREITVVPPQAGSSLSEADYLAWGGWRYLGASGRSVDRPFSVVTKDWGTLESAATADTTWRVKFVIRTRVDVLTADSDKRPQQVRATLEQPQVDEILNAIGLMKTAVYRNTGGKLKLEPEVVIDRNPIFFGSDEVAFGPSWVESQSRLNANRGRFDSDDKVNRGPFHSIVFVHPITGLTPVNAVVDGLPTQAFSFYGSPVVGSLASAIGQGLQYWTKYAGYPSESGQSTPAFDAIASRKAPTVSELAARTAPISVGSAAAFPLLSTGPISDELVVAIEDDLGRGKVLSVSERSPRRSGGFALPVREGAPLAKIADTPTFQFWMKTDSMERFGLRFTGPKGAMNVSLGPEMRGSNPTPTRSIAVTVPVGQWTRVSVDLRPLTAVIGDTVTRVVVGPTERALAAERLSAGSVDVHYDGFDFVAEPTTNADAPAPTVPPLSVENLKTADDASRLIMLADPSVAKGPEYLEVLSLMAYDLNGRVGAAAVKCLAANGSEAAQAVIRRVARIGTGEAARIEAIRALGETGSDKVVGDLVAVLGNPSVAARREAVFALKKLPGRQALIVRSALMGDSDPEVRLAAIDTAELAEDMHVRKLLWAAVNEGEDLLRVRAALRLIQSTDPATKAEGYKVIRDESTGARIWMVRGLADGNVAHRPTLLLALADSDPEVRAEAILAFIKQPTKPTTDELASVKADPYVVVQEALKKLAEAK